LKCRNEQQDLIFFFVKEVLVGVWLLFLDNP
jgi:hypothetical protein